MDVGDLAETVAVLTDLSTDAMGLPVAACPVAVLPREDAATPGQGGQREAADVHLQQQCRRP